MKAISTQAAAQKILDGVKLVWLVEIDADAPNAATSTQYYGSRKYTLTHAYTDQLSVNGLQLEWTRLRVGGGLASVSNARLTFRNEAILSDLVDLYFLENDEVRVYLVFVNGSEVLADRVPVGQFVIENYPYTERLWTMQCIDGSDKDFRDIPTELINLVDYADAPLNALGKVVPVPFGVLRQTPHDLDGSGTFLAPAINTDIFTHTYTSGTLNNAFADAFQYYPNSRRLAKLSAITQTAGSFTINDGSRQMFISPNRKKSTNDVAGFKSAIDRDASTSVTVSSGANLDLIFAGTSGQLGTMSNLYLQVAVTGAATWNYDVFHGTTNIAAATGQSGDVQIDLSGQIATYFADKWDMEQLSIQISTAADLAFDEIYLDVRFEDQESRDRESLPVFQEVDGFEDLAASYKDGAVISSAGVTLENPVHILESIFRAKMLLNIPAASMDLSAFDAAATARATWKFAFVLDQPVEIEFLNQFAFQAALHLFKDGAGAWNAVAQDKTATPVHYFSAHNMAVKNPREEPSRWETNIQFSRTPIRDLINEVVLRYGLDRTTGEYTKLSVSSGRHRVAGTCIVNATAGTLTDSSADFLTDSVQVGDTVYVEGDKDYDVDAVQSETVLEISGVGGVNDNGTLTNYWAGPNLTGPMKRSQTRYKTEHALGDRFNQFSRRGGFTSDFINDDTTAQNLITHIEEWRSQRRLSVEFATWWNAIDAELGDVCFVDHTWLSTTKRPSVLTTLSGGINNSTTTIPLISNAVRVDDYILIGTEIMLVTARTPASSNVTATRAQCNTQAAAANGGAEVLIMNRVKWEITGIRADISTAQIRIEAQETPPDYNPTGLVSAAGSANWSAATSEQKVSSGYASTFSGRVVDDDEYSAISYVGASVA